MRRNFDLRRMRARRVNAFVKSYRRPFERFECHRACDVSQTNESLRAMQRERADCAHRLRSVEKCETFLYFELQRRNLRALERCRRS